MFFLGAVSMKKIGFIITVLLLAQPYLGFGAYNSNSAESYLLSHSSSAWATLGLSALNSPSIATDHLKNINTSSAINLAAPILALTAISQDPRTFDSVDYVAKLKNYYDNGQIGDPGTLNDDFFGILALVSADESPTDPVITNTRTFILSNQKSNGGWGFTTTSSPDTNMTSAAVLALLASGSSSSDPNISRAVTYLKNAQNSDGGFPYDPESTFGTDSDSSSTAWVIWSLNALNINPTSWSKGNNNPISYLEGNQTSSGYFEYQKSSGEDSFSPITTAYAAIALSGKALPLKKSTTAQPTFGFRIEGKSETVCEGKTTGPTALDIVKNASKICSFTYNIENTSFGPYLNKIGDDAATGLIGWLYLVNNISPSVGAADYTLQTGDEVLWFYGEYNLIPTKLTVSPLEATSSSTVTATVESYTNSSWSPLSDAIVSFGATTAQTNNSGQATLSPNDGFYKVSASKSGYIRSNKILIKIGNPSSSSVDLSVNVKGSVAGEDTKQPPDNISFTVDTNNVQFSEANAGGSTEKVVTLKNNGIDIHVETEVKGGNLFAENLTINSKLWKMFALDIPASQSQDLKLKLLVPQGTKSGKYSGQLIFWASAKN